jgi:nitrogen fixation/metabolism regulation signal transduction histidine kinase
VPPGRYRARLTVGEEVLEEPIEVVMNPGAQVSSSDLDEQFRVSKRIREMQSEVNELLRALDSLKGQIEERRKAAETSKKALGGAVEKSLDETVGRIDELSGALAIPERKDRPGTGEPPRLSERLSDLFGSVDSVSAAPTRAQREYLAVLEKDLVHIRSEAGEFFDSIPELNEALEAEGVPGLLSSGPKR